MKDLSQRCIFSGSTENLNTVMEITLNDEKFKVAISSEYEDEASLSAIKKQIPKRLDELDKKKKEMEAKLEEFKMIAAELGFELTPKGQSSSGLIIAENKTRSANPPDPNALRDAPTAKIGDSTFKVQRNTRAEGKEAGLSAEEAEAALDAAKRRSAGVQGSTGATSGEAARFTKHHLPESVAIRTREGVKEVSKPEIYAKKMQTVRGREGIPTAIPLNLSGSDGETTIQIVNTGGNRTIQERTKQLNVMREMGNLADYSQVCKPCQGTGQHARKLCRNCGGAGFII